MTWYRINNTSPDRGYIHTPKVYMINNVEVGDGGLYECQGTTDYRDVFYAQGVLKVIGM